MYSSINWTVLHFLPTFFISFHSFLSLTIYIAFMWFIDSCIWNRIYYLCNLIKNCDAYIIFALSFYTTRGSFPLSHKIYLPYAYACARLCKSMYLVLNMVRLTISTETQLQYVHDKSLRKQRVSIFPFHSHYYIK